MEKGYIENSRKSKILRAKKFQRNTAKKSSDADLKSIKGDKSFQILKLALDDLKEKYKLAHNEILSLIEEKPISKEIMIPVSVFEVKGLSALEAICKYLKEEMDLSYSKIALLLNRDSRTIWTTYKNSVIKKKEKLSVKESRFRIPVSALANRKFSILESVACYLRDESKLRYSEIGFLLNRDERNIWTACNRAMKKKNG